MIAFVFAEFGEKQMTYCHGNKHDAMKNCGHAHATLTAVANCYVEEYRKNIGTGKQFDNILYGMLNPHGPYWPASFQEEKVFRSQIEYFLPSLRSYSADEELDALLVDQQSTFMITLEEKDGKVIAYAGNSNKIKEEGSTKLEAIGKLIANNQDLFNVRICMRKDCPKADKEEVTC